MMHVPLLSRAIACLLLVCLPLQAMAIASARALGPAHVHVTVDADADADDDPGHAHGHDDGDDEHHHHHDGAIGHHTHDPQLPGVVYLEDDDDKRSADAATRLASKRWVIDHESLAPAFRIDSPGSPCFSPAPLAATARFCSQVVAPLERPPR
jgi:hypothetical protein